MVLRVGILSDTHLVRPDNRFKKQVRHCFQGCGIIIHAGDMTHPSALEVFSEMQVFAVHGNMCDASARALYPSQQIFSLGKYTIGLTHGAGLGLDIEGALFDLFPDADCMIYGHTHRPSIQHYGKRIILNPGCFRSTGRYGASGTYAILEMSDHINASLHEVPNWP